MDNNFDFDVGDIICHRENNKKWLITKVSDGNYYLKGLDRRVYIVVTVSDLPFFSPLIKAKRLAKEIYG
jgi:hypothetical protein